MAEAHVVNAGHSTWCGEHYMPDTCRRAEAAGGFGFELDVFTEKGPYTVRFPLCRTSFKDGYRYFVWDAEKILHRKFLRWEDAHDLIVSRYPFPIAGHETWMPKMYPLIHIWGSMKSKWVCARELVAALNECAPERHRRCQICRKPRLRWDRIPQRRCSAALDCFCSWRCFAIADEKLKKNKEENKKWLNESRRLLKQTRYLLRHAQRNR